MVTKAQSKATDRYRKSNVKQIVVRFYPKDAKLYAHVKESGGSTYLKELAEREVNRGSSLS